MCDNKVYDLNCLLEIKHKPWLLLTHKIWKRNIRTFITLYVQQLLPHSTLMVPCRHLWPFRNALHPSQSLVHVDAVAAMMTAIPSPSALSQHSSFGSFVACLVFFCLLVPRLLGTRVAHQARAYPSFCSMKRQGVLLLPSGWNVSPSHGYPPALSSPVHLDCSQDNSQKNVTQGFILTIIGLFFFEVGEFLRLQKFVESSSVFKLILDDSNTSLVAYFNWVTILYIGISIFLTYLWWRTKRKSHSRSTISKTSPKDQWSWLSHKTSCLARN